MILSKYNVYVKYKKGYIIYNTLSNYVVYSDCGPDELVNEENDTLVSSGILIDDVDDERQKMTNRLIERFNEVSQYRIELMLTHDCNLSCSYCYQKERLYNNNSMNIHVMNDTVQFINKLKRQSSITFYGGEPILHYDKIAWFSKRLTNVSTYTIITNGTLLNRMVVAMLIENGVKCCQITIDGNEKTHDTKRYYHSGKGSYQDILSNILDIIDMDIEITIRINISNQNIEDIRDMMMYFYNTRLYKKLKFSISDVIGLENDKAYSTIMATYDRFTRLGFNINIPVTLPCLIGSGYSYIIDSEGYIYPCMYYAGADKNWAVGTVKDGIDASALKRYKKLRPWSDCLDCSYVGICAGGCRLRANDLYEKGCQKAYMGKAIEREVISTYLQYK